MYKSKMIITICLVMVLVSGKLLSQTVTMPEGNPVIDLMELDPLGCVLSSDAAIRRREEMKYQSASNNKYLQAGKTVTGTNGRWNQLMSGKIQVMWSDHRDSPQTWQSAYNICQEYQGEFGYAGEWRLPTQRELMLIMALSPAMLEISRTCALLNKQYWSQTEDDNYATQAWATDIIGDHPVSVRNKGFALQVRCVRDL